MIKNQTVINNCLLSRFFAIDIIVSEEHPQYYVKGLKISMKRKVLSIILVLAMVVSAFSLTSCNATPEEGTFTRITVDVNPSIEFMVDDENKVASVTALNDDGSILIAGEAFVGKTPEEATELVLSLACETGYLVKGENADTEANTVKISVSGDSKYATQLLNDVEKTAGDVLEKFDITGKIEKAEALKSEALQSLALSTSLYTEEELAEMSDEELYKVIAAGRIETALLLTEDMREAYYKAKEHKISFAESEATAKIIETMGGIHDLTYSIYKTALDSYSKSITALDELRYNMLVSPESEYQKSLAYLRESKTELLKQKNYTATLDVNGTEYTLAVEKLTLTEEEYDKALAAYEALGEKANEALETLIAALRTSEEAIRSLEDKFSDDIRAELSAKASEIEADVNAAKDSFFESFEEAHKDDISSIEENLKAQKQALIDSIGQ